MSIYYNKLLESAPSSAMRTDSNENDNNLYKEKLYAEYNKRVASGEFTGDEDIDFWNVMAKNNVIAQESSLNSKKRNSIPDEDFGIPSQRKYPMHDKNHVNLAIKMFGHVDEEHEKELAKNIIKKIKQYDMEDDIIVGKDNKFANYYNESCVLNEGTHTTNSKKKIYHLSPDKLNDNTLRPRVPKNTLPGEDNKTARVCFSTSIGNCLMALSQNLAGKEFYVYVPADDTEYCDVNRKEVPDSNLTKEKWVTSNVKVKCIGKIKAISAIDKPYYFDYPNDKSKEGNHTYKWNWEWVEKNINESYIEEKKSEDDKELFPIYIITSFTNSTFGKAIRKTTGGFYTHASMAFSAALDKMYSFQFVPGKGAFTVESLDDYNDNYVDAEIQVSTIFFKKKEYNIIKDKVNMYLQNVKKTTYNTIDLFNIIFDKAALKANDLSMICSEFVDSLIKMVKVDLTDKPSNLVKPDDMANIRNPKVYKIYEGKVKDYDTDKMARLVNKMKRGKVKAIKEAIVPIFEIKEFPVQFDDDGNLLISKKENIDFNAEYQRTKKLRAPYIKYSNLEGLKYEASKLWFLNTILMKKIEKETLTEEDKNKLVLYRSRILTEFSLYMAAIQKIDNNFNFASYYETTPFSDAKIKINGSTIKYSAKLLKQFFA